MARPLRLEHSGAVWHVTSRGNERRDIFRDDRDRERFLGILADVVGAMKWRLHAFVLMGNHFHLLIETPEPNLSRGMRQINGVYTQWFNWRRRRPGHLMQGRFKSVLVEKQSHLLELARYIVLNPVRAGFVPTAGKWRWSNYRATAGLGKPPDWLEVDWTLGQFGSKGNARARYRKFVAEAKGSQYAPWEQLAGQIFLGGEGFRKQVQQMINASPRSSEIPRAQRSPLRPTLQHILAVTAREFGITDSDWTRKRQTPARLALASLARTEAGLRLSDFAPALGVKPWAASHLATAAQARYTADRAFRRHLHQIQTSLQKITFSQT
jgi:putative transposase